MIDKLALPEIRELLEAGDVGTLAEVLNRWDPADLASLLGRLDETDQVRVLRAVSGKIAAQTFEYLSLTSQESLIAVLPEPETVHILEAMAADDRTALLEELDTELAQRLIGQLSPEQRTVAESLLRYSPDSVGRLMTPDYIAVRREWTIKHVLDFVRATVRTARRST
ncbi:MAG: hypothetical protein U0794_05605 [Isosphaeraceae bacterium]